MKARLFGLVLALLLTACAPSPGGLLSQATPTATPFLPDFATHGLPASQTPEPEYSDLIPVAFEAYPPPAASSDIALPNPVGRFVQPEGQINILILGSDQRPNDGGYRTDVVMLLTIHPGGKRVTMTSFPRDLYVYVPGWRMDRINVAQARGGFEMMANTMEYNFGVRPDYYLMVTFWGFQGIVDTLGGITVNSARGLTDHRGGGYGSYSVPAGPVLMDGETALWYVRSRGTSSDFDRTRREQEVLQAIFYRLISLNAVARAPQLYDQYRQTVTTDISLDAILPLLPLAAEIGAGGGQTAHFAIGPEHVNSFRTSGGAAVLLPDRAAVLGIMREALSVEEQVVSE